MSMTVRTNSPERDPQSQGRWLNGKNNLPAMAADREPSVNGLFAEANRYPPPARSSISAQVLSIFTLAWLWYHLVAHLDITWDSIPQYSYGWTVPFLCVYMLWEAWQLRFEPGRTTFPFDGARLNAAFRPLMPVAVCAAALLYPPIRLLQAGNPDWRLASWASALLVIALTLALLPLLLRAAEAAPARRINLRRFVFPICFFLLAVPWPSRLEVPLVGKLALWSSALAVEGLNLIGVPAIQIGSFIEVGSSLVNVTDGCSGIRSFQSSLMVSVFLGHLYSFTIFKRLALCGAGMVLAFLSNAARIAVLAWASAAGGENAFDQWHDRAGFAMPILTFGGIWAAGWALSAINKNASNSECTPSPRAQSNPGLAIPPQAPVWTVAGLSVWVVAADLAVSAWYHSREERLGPALAWEIALPPDRPATTIPDKMSGELLRADRYLRSEWAESNLWWQLVFIQWNAGPAAGFLSRVHNPHSCMPAAGFKMLSMSPPKLMTVHDLSLPCRCYTFEKAGTFLHLWFFRWDDRAKHQTMSADDDSLLARMFRAVVTGCGNAAQRTLEIAVSGAADSAEMEAAVRNELSKIIVPSRTGAAAH